MRRLLALTALLALATACGSDERETAATTPVPSGAGTEIAGDSLDGEALSLDDYRGKRVLLNVWSSW
jgi:hypothetical protein